MKIALFVAGIAVLVFVVGAILNSRRASQPKISNEARPLRDVAELVAPLRRPASLVRRTDKEVRSYLGGRPPSYEGFTWPAKAGRPLAFLGCIDLSEVTNIEWLPKSGWLLFFYDIEEQPWGFDPKDRGGWAVQYVPHTTPVDGTAAAPEALPADWNLPIRRVACHPKEIAPSWDHPAVEGLTLTDPEEDALMDLREAAYEGAPRHQIGGFPDPIQNAGMEMECQLASNGLYLGDAMGYEDPRARELESGAADWRLLLQFDSDDDLDVMWGDGGMLYFWIREADARRADFSGTWLVLQCY